MEAIQYLINKHSEIKICKEKEKVKNTWGDDGLKATLITDSVCPVSL